MNSHICCECVCYYQDLAAAASTFMPLSVPYALIWRCMKMRESMSLCGMKLLAVAATSSSTTECYIEPLSGRRYISARITPAMLVIPAPVVLVLCCGRSKNPQG